MHYEYRISASQGNYIVASGTDFEDILIKEPINIDGSLINPGEMTDLYGWFNKQIRYCGYLIDPGETKKAVFYIGQGTSSLFENGGYYYDVTYIFAPDRIGKSYKIGSFRDCFLRKNKKNQLIWK